MNSSAKAVLVVWPGKVAVDRLSLIFESTILVFVPVILHFILGFMLIQGGL
jgi:hypothetical protein